MTPNRTAPTKKRLAPLTAPVRPPVPAHVMAAIELRMLNFRPRIGASLYEKVRAVVIELARLTEPRSVHDARRAMTFLNQFVTWMWMETGCELVPDALLRDSAIVRYVNTGIAHLSYVSRFDQARFLGTLTTKITGRPTSRLVPPPATRLAPYSGCELARLNSWAESMNTPLQSRRAWALLALCGGAGLTAQEVAACRTTDVTKAGNTWWVNVPGDRARLVPAGSLWSHAFERASDGAGNDFFHGYRLDEYPPRMIQTFISEHPSTVRLSPIRLRSGWIVNLIDDGVPAPHIAALAGLTTIASLTEYYAFSRPSSLDDNLASITGTKAVDL